MRKLITFAMVLSAVALHGQVFPPSNGGGPALPVSIANGGTGATTAANALVALFGNQSANTVYAGPASGSAAAPTFRALTGADLPACNDWQNTSAGVASSNTMPSNVNSVVSFTAPCSGTFTKMTFFLNTVDNSTNLYDFGWYTFNGTTTITKACDSGAIAGSTFGVTPSVFITLTMLSSGCTFSAGTRYYLGWTGNATTLKYGCGANVPTLDREGSNGVSSGGVLATPLTVTGGTTSWNQVTCVPWVDMHN